MLPRRQPEMQHWQRWRLSQQRAATTRNPFQLAGHAEPPSPPKNATTAQAPAQPSTAPDADKKATGVAEQERRMRILARQVAAFEQKRIRLTDDERTQYEWYLFESMRRVARGQQPLDPPESWLNKNYADAQEQARAAEYPRIKASQISDEDWDLMDLYEKLRHPQRFSAAEYESLRRRAQMEVKRRYYAGSDWGFFRRILDQLLNPAWDGTGTLNDIVGIIGPFGGAPPAGLSRSRPAGPLASPTKPDPNSGRTKPPFPPAVAAIRARPAKGKDVPHPSHVKAAESEEAAARYIHDNVPDEVVILWGKAIGANGPDIISYNLRLKVVTLWDDKFRSELRRIRSSRTFAKESQALEHSVVEARRAIQNSSLSAADRAAAERSIERGNFRTRTLGSGKVMNSVIGGQP
jgi:hypothetical protein